MKITAKALITTVLLGLTAACGAADDAGTSALNDHQTSLEGILTGRDFVTLEDGRQFCAVYLKTDRRTYGLVHDDIDFCYEASEDFGSVVKTRSTKKISDRDLLKKLRENNDDAYYLINSRGYEVIPYETKLGKKQRLPRQVYNAVKSNYEIGRHNHDFGGIASITVYNLDQYKGRERTEWNVMLDLVKKSAGKYDGLLGECHITFEIAEPEKCAAKLLRSTRSSSRAFYGFLEDLGYESDDRDIMQFNKDLQVIKGYVKEQTGRDTKVFDFVGVGMNVDIMNYIFIDFSRNYAIVINGDYGA